MSALTVSNTGNLEREESVYRFVISRRKALLLFYMLRIKSKRI